MDKKHDKQNYIGRDMYRNKNTDRFSEKQGDPDTQQDEQKQGLVDFLVKYSVELLVVIVFFFIVISTAFSYEQASPFLSVSNNTDEAIVSLINLKF